MLKIGEFSKLSRTSIRMLRHYDAIGLLTPALTDGQTGYRYYGEDQLSTANRIAALRQMGFSLAAIGEVLSCGSQDALEPLFLRRREEALAEAAQAERRLALLDAALEGLRKDEAMMHYDVTVKTLPERQVASVRQVIPGYDRQGDLWGLFRRETAGMPLRGGELCLAIYHDGEYKESDVDVEIQMTVAEPFPDTEHVKYKTVPAVEAACAVFQGPYDQIGAVNEAVAAWVEEKGYAFAGPFFNIYRVGPHETRDPEEYVTEVCYPVQKR